MDEKDKAMLLLSLDQVETLLGLVKKEYQARTEFLELSGYSLVELRTDERLSELRDIISQLGG